MDRNVDGPAGKWHGKWHDKIDAEKTAQKNGRRRHGVNKMAPAKGARRKERREKRRLS